MRRACQLTLKFATASKRKRIAQLLVAYRGAVNFFIRSLWKTRGKLDAPTLARLKNTRLSARYKSQALKQALEIVVSTKKSAKTLGIWASRPMFRGSAVLDAKFVTIEVGRGTFDVVVKLSTLKFRRQISIPTRRTAVMNKWSSTPGAVLVQGCGLSERGITLWVELPDAPVKTGDTVGVDIGINKLMSLSDGSHIGTEFRDIMVKLRRRKKGSKGFRRAQRERENYINRAVNSLPWDEVGTIGVENLKNVKKGKSPKRSKTFRKAVASWTYCKVLERIGHKAQENRVLVFAVPSAYTSQQCPECGTTSRENRKGEKFVCVSCQFAADADTVGARNVLARTLSGHGEPRVPRASKRKR